MSESSSARMRRPISLWVEGEVTRSYLLRVWQDSDIDVLAGGGPASVRELVESAGAESVFGYLSRGFDVDASNRSGWAREGSPRVLVGAVFEAGSFLFDEDAIAGSILNTSGQSAQAIAAEMQALAAPLSWWMACRSVIASLSRRACQAFVPPPDAELVLDQASALAWIATSSWVVSTAPGVPAMVTPAALEEQLVAEERRFARAVLAGHWKTEIPGRGVLLQLISSVWNRRPPSVSDRDAANDFAKAIADQQRKLGTVPREVQELRDALRARAGLAR